MEGPRCDSCQGGCYASARRLGDKRDRDADRDELQISKETVLGKMLGCQDALERDRSLAQHVDSNERQTKAS